MEDRYIVIYDGKVNPVVSLEHTIEQVSLVFKIPEDKAKAFVLTKKPLIIKKDLTLEQAEKFQKVLSKLGLESKITKKVIQGNAKANQINNNIQQQSSSKDFTISPTINSAINEHANIAKTRQNAPQKKRRFKSAILLSLICLTLIFSTFLFVPKFFATTYTQDEVYNKKNVWYLKENKQTVNGIIEMKDNNGNLKAIIPIKNGLIHGLLKTYYPQQNSIMSEVTYIHGKKDGLEKVYSEEGYILGEQTYKNNELHGESKAYHTSGKLDTKSIIDNGKYVLMEMYDSSGQLMHKIEFENGNKSHEYTYKNGQLDDETIYRNGKPETIHHHN